MSAEIDSVAAAQPRSIPTVATVRASTRLASIDMLRGLVIVLMALDHVRDYFTNVHFDPLDLTQTNTALFLTRWITHFCAPIFIFLAGVSVHLMSQRATPAELTRFTFTRGLWLVVLEATVVQFAWTFNFDYSRGVFLQVIWAIGMSMIVLSGLVRLPRRVIAAIAVAMIVGHNLLDGVDPASFGALAPLWSVLHARAQLPYAFVSYPLIPWIGVMALGYVVGPVFDRDAAARRSALVVAGILAWLAFLALRAGNFYGDMHHWSPQASSVMTVLSFIDVTKYPPSLQYLLITLGGACFALALFDAVRGGLAEAFRTFGRVPLFVYVLHIMLAHVAAGVIAFLMGFGNAVLAVDFRSLPPDWGFGLPGVYLAWILVLVTLYPACKWYAEVKRRRNDWWLAYL
jgi:uncharacterized membrane protein